MNLIDSHLHLGKFNKSIYRNRIKKRNRLLKGTKIGIISSLNGATVSQQEGNRETFNFIQSSSYDLRGLIWINPYDPDWKKDAEHCLNWKGCVGIKLHPSLNHYYPTKRILNPILKFAQHHHLPIAVHTGKQGYCNAKVFTPFIQNFSQVTFVLYHMSPLDEAIELCQRFKNVFLEVSGRDIDQVREAVGQCGASRVIFGSDEHLTYQKKNPVNLSGAIRKNFSRKDAQRILAQNAQKVFKLK